jgi:hypothetical protein
MKRLTVLLLLLALAPLAHGQQWRIYCQNAQLTNPVACTPTWQNPTDTGDATARAMGKTETNFNQRFAPIVQTPAEQAAGVTPTALGYPPLKVAVKRVCSNRCIERAVWHRGDSERSLAV